MSYYVISREDYLMHHGIKGQKWGVRRYQNEDGTLTRAGKLRYNYGGSNRRGRRAWYKDQYEHLKGQYDKEHEGEKQNSAYRKARNEYIKNNYEKLGGKKGTSFEEDKKLYNTDKAITIGAMSTVGAIATIGTINMTNLVVDSSINKYNEYKYYQAVENDPDYMFKNNNDYIYKEGHEIGRKSRDKDEVGKGYDSLYVNTNKKDIKLFNSFLGTQGMGGAFKPIGSDKEYMYKMKTNKEIRGIPERKLLRIMYNYEQEEKAKADNKWNKEMAKSFPLLYSRDPEKFATTVKAKTVDDEGFEKIWNSMSDNEKTDYNSKLLYFTNSFYQKNKAINSKAKKIQEEKAAYIKKEAEKEGYNAMPDLVDRRHFGQDALVIFDPDKNVTTISVKTKTIVNDIIDNLTMNAVPYEITDKKYNDHAKGGK